MTKTISQIKKEKKEVRALWAHVKVCAITGQKANSEKVERLEVLKSEGHVPWLC